MKRLTVLMALALFLASSPSVYAKEWDNAPRFARGDATQERGVLPALMRWFDRSNADNNREREDTTKEEEIASQQPETPLPGTASPAGNEDAPTAPAPSNPAPTTSVVIPSSTKASAPAWGATTTPILNTHDGVTSDIYTSEWPLNRAQSGLLFVFSMGLALSGLMLAERDSLRRLFPSGTLLAPSSSQLSEKRTVLS